MISAAAMRSALFMRLHCPRIKEPIVCPSKMPFGRSKAKSMKPHSIQTNALPNSTPSPRRYVRALRVVAWNALFIISGLLLVALAGEAYFRITKPFIENTIPIQFVDGVGRIREPNSELRYGRWDDDFWVISRTNSQGFLDREPVSPERAAAGCHIAFIGDSFVEAQEAPISDKFHVRLEDMAARELPRLAITTQAYGIGGTGQINQLPFYDEYARHLNPKVVFLVFYLNDFAENSTALQSLILGTDPDRMPFVSAQKGAGGNMELRPPDPEYRRFRLPRLPKPRYAWYESEWERLVWVSRFAKWVDASLPVKLIRSNMVASPNDDSPQHTAWAAMIAERPCCASLMDGWRPINWLSINNTISEERLPPAFEEALEYTAFGVDQFKRRADRDGATLAILAATDEMGTRGDPQFDRLSAIAETRGIPVISQYDYVVSQGHDYRDARFRNDYHWNATGHQWAAEAVLEWLKENQDACD